MIKLGRLFLAAACVLILAPAALADDAALAAKLVGSWEGKWEFGEAGGRLTARITASSGNSLKGETKWFGTAVGDFEDRFSSAKLKDGKLKVSEQTMDFEATVSEDGTSMTGTWTSPMASGPMSLKKQTN
jgi:hypothetical protein